MIETWDPEQALAADTISLSRISTIAFSPMDQRTRNLYITNTYEQMSDRYKALLGPEANWFSYACWASKFVRNLMSVPLPLIGPALLRSFGFGNRHVFANITRIAFVFEQAFTKTSELTNEALEARWSEFLMELQQPLARPVGLPGMALPGATSQSTNANVESAPVVAVLRVLDGTFPKEIFAVRPSNYLIARAFRCYFEALLENRETNPNAVLREECIRRGSMLLLLHEQRNIDGSIAAGFRMPVRRVLFLSFLAPHRKWRLRKLTGLRAKCEEAFISLATHYLAFFKIGDKKVWIGKPKKLPSVDAKRFPVWKAVLQGFEKNRRWTELSYRMAFLVRMLEGHPNPPTDVLSAKERRDVTTMPVVTSVSDGTTNIEPTRPQPKQLDEWARGVLKPLRLEIDICDVDAEALEYPALLASLQTPLSELIPRELAISMEEVRKRIAQLNDMGLFDPTLQRVAANFFQKWRGVTLPMLFTRSLPEAYAAAEGTRMLGMHSSLRSTPIRRTGQTAMFLFDIFNPNEYWTEDGALRSLAGLRLIHAGARKHVIDRNIWDDQTRHPLNLEDTLGTAFTFSVSVLQSFADFDISFESLEGATEYLQTSLALAVVLGVPIQSLTENGKWIGRDKVFRLANQLRQDQHRPNVAGVELFEAMLEGMSDAFPRVFAKMPTDIAWALGDGAVLEVLQTPRGRPKVQTRIRGVYRTLVRRANGSTVGARLFQKIGEHIERSIRKEDFGRAYRHSRADAGSNIDDAVAVFQNEFRFPISDTESQLVLRNELRNVGVQVAGYQGWELELLVNG
jgi:ER-bound oxygenase mpaB/B'/Rubber oxygenase, catalytic domain